MGLKTCAVDQLVHPLLVWEFETQITLIEQL